MAWLATLFVALGASGFKLQSNRSTVLEDSSNAWELVLKVTEDDRLRACPMESRAFLFWAYRDI